MKNLYGKKPFLQRENRDLVKSGLIIWLLLFSLLSVYSIRAAEAQGDNWLEDYNFRKEIEVNQTAGAGEDFQISMNLLWEVGTDYSDTIYLNAHTQEDFDDINFTRSDGSTGLSYYVPPSSIDNGISCEAWVKIKGDLSSSNITIYLYYGNSTISSSSSADSTFIEDISGLIVGSHLEEGSGSDVTDGCGYDGSLVGPATWSWVDGYHGGGLQFVGDSWISYPNRSLYYFDTEFTLVGWVNHTSTLGYTAQSNDATHGLWNEITNEGYHQSFLWVGGSQYGLGDYGSVNNDWVQIGAKYESGVGFAIFQNATTLTSRNDFSGSVDNSGTGWAVGAGFNAVMDDILLFNQSLSDATLGNMMDNFPDSYIEPFYCMVRKWLETQPVFDPGEEISAADYGLGEFARRGEIVAAGLIASLIIIPILILLIAASRRR